MFHKLRLLALAAVVTAGCGAAPSVSSVSLSANPSSVLSVLVSFTALGAQSARVVAVAGTERLVTPEVAIGPDGRAQVAVLGLAPSTLYQYTVEASGANGVTATGAISATTAPLPPELASLHLAITPGTGAPEAGYYLVCGLGSDAFAVDQTGAVRWYRAFGAATQETKLQEDGTFTTYVGASSGWQPVPGVYQRYLPDGTIIDAHAAADDHDADDGDPSVYTDNHELLVTRDAAGAEHFHFIAYQERPLSATDATLAAWHQVVRQTADGEVELRWKSASRFTSEDTTEPIPLPGVFDVDHANALVIDPADGNYVVSFRDLDALAKVDYQTGDVLWQLGGKRTDLTVQGDPLGGFFGQHSVRTLPDNHLLIYDNGLQHSPPESRAVEYKLDLAAKTATMVWQFRHQPPVFTPVVGSVERLANGHTLIAFANVGLVDEVDAQGRVVWEGQLFNGSMPAGAYRVRRLPSLYAFAQP